MICEFFQESKISGKKASDGNWTHKSLDYVVTEETVTQEYQKLITDVDGRISELKGGQSAS